MDYIELIQKTIDYIEENIEEKITVEELAYLAGFSTYHFYRVFGNLVGLTVMEYVNKRKFQYALYDLQNNEKIIDIAMKYGFETHSGFTKAFKRYFGCAPNFYRIHSPKEKPERVILKDLIEKKVGGLLMQPKIIERKEFKVVGYEFKNNMKNVLHTKDIPAFWSMRGFDDNQCEVKLYQKLEPKKHGEYCICINTDMETDDFSYIMGVGVETFDNAETDMYKITVPEGKYAVFTTPGVDDDKFVESIQGTWKYILEEWFPKSGYEIDEKRYDFEYYDERCHPWENEKVSMEIHIPIIEK